MLSIRPTQLRVDLSAIRHNVREVAEAAAPAKVLAVVKANAYGHGAVQVSQAALEAGADMLAVALIEEGAQLRQAGVTAPILMLGTTDVHAAEAAVEYDVTPVVFLPEVIFALESVAAKKGVCASAQIKIDTGMNRIGVRTEEELSAVLDAVAKCPHIRITGGADAFCHGGCAGERLRRRTDRALRAHDSADARTGLELRASCRRVCRRSALSTGAL